MNGGCVPDAAAVFASGRCLPVKEAAVIRIRVVLAIDADCAHIETVDLSA
jgi:hypothetical protein